MRTLTTAAARALDRAAQERYAIPGIVLMENAAIGISALARGMLGDASGARVVVVCGPGNNGGDGYAIARHLQNAGAVVSIIPVGSPREGSDAATNERVAFLMGMPRVDLDALAAAPDLIIDAVFGSGLDRPVEGAALAAIQAINASPSEVLAVDIPSGLDADTGLPLGEAVRATVTAITIAARPACRAPHAKAWLGTWRVIDIGCPRSLVAEFATQATTD
ncbi:MAG: NAD(P)H-hydrate epimerase [Phycisphaerae bacterium]|nr:NAD(P)H-hydrate epimerase [Phycisphaerae bacterium]